MLRCPECGKVSPDESMKCECGYLFPSRSGSIIHTAVSGSREVIVKDIKMKFSSMVWFMVKWAIASIPAIFIIGAIVSLAIMIITGITKSPSLQ